MSRRMSRPKPWSHGNRTSHGGEAGDGPPHPPSRLLALSFGALGIVYGDIGTSPLYALRECFHSAHGLPATPGNVFGILSLVFWSLVLIISVKYLVFVMRADNCGEGGILALMALVPAELRSYARRRWALVALGLFGAALLYGDGMITPAISVLSAVEGLEIAAPIIRHLVVPITLVILVGLFFLQHRGTARMGRIFGPVMLLWFACLAAMGTAAIRQAPRILGAVDPVHACRFFAAHHGRGFLTLGAVFLVVTGGEALYADMGHFGRRPIRLAWFALVLPALLLEYFGQGALLLVDPGAADNPFYRLAPGWALYPLVGLSTLATVIASQAVISGAFSLTRQAVQLGYCPRLKIVHTSPEEIGQIYIPFVNWALAAATLGLVLGFRTSTNLAAAYGVAVTTTMGITTILAYVVARHRWGWSRAAVAPFALLFLAVDLSFFAANVVKIEHGGWFPLLVGGVIYVLLATWKRGRERVAERLAHERMPYDEFVAGVPEVCERVPGVAVFLSWNADSTPTALLYNYKYNRALHEKVVLLALLGQEVPEIPEEDRVAVEDLGRGFYRLRARHGFQQVPNVPGVLARAGAQGLALDPESTLFFVPRESILATAQPGMALWRERLFSLLSRLAQRPTEFFSIPPDRVIELGVQVRL
jgi:KUP system potassium uptake protein